MRKVVLLMHITLDGFAAGPNGEMNWISIDDEMFDDVAKLTDKADAAIFGRTTYGMMEGYWPAAGKQPGASKHDIEHSNWLNAANKIVLSTTMKESNWTNTTIVPNAEMIRELKSKEGKDMLMIGSISSAHALMKLDLIDEYWLNVNPVILGNGMKFFGDEHRANNLKLVEEKKYKPGVIGLHYEVDRP